MSIIFDKLEEHSNKFKNILSNNAFLKEENHPFDWQNIVYESAYIRRAHLDIIDLRNEKKMYMMHLCIFPKFWDSAPIYGFDLVAGQNKVTGAFHDFSSVTKEIHPMSRWFSEEASNHSWTRTRELPEWARNIFSDSMIAASNIQTEFELKSFLNLSLKSLNYYIEGLSKYQPDMIYEDKINNQVYKDSQNYYCYNQKQNPHTPRVLQSLGFDKSTIRSFIDTCLFPEVD